MDVLVPAFASALLAEWGDKSQLVLAFLAARSGRPWIVFFGFVAAALVSSAAMAVAGGWIADTIDLRARGLLLALALLFAGAAGLVTRRDPALGSRRVPLLVAAFLLCLAAELGDRTQFLTFALAARFDAPAFAGVGAAAGMVAAGLPAALTGAAVRTALPLRPLRWAGAALFLVTGFIVAVHSLRLA